MLFALNNDYVEVEEGRALHMKTEPTRRSLPQLGSESGIEAGYYFRSLPAFHRFGCTRPACS